jgi:hypothetical protein
MMISIYLLRYEFSRVIVVSYSLTLLRSRVGIWTGTNGYTRFMLVALRSENIRFALIDLAVLRFSTIIGVCSMRVSRVLRLVGTGVSLTSIVEQVCLQDLTGSF